MTNLWRQLETLFEEEIRSADLAQADLEKIMKIRIEKAEGHNITDPTLLNLAERGVRQWQAECHQRLGQAVHGLLRDARQRAAETRTQPSTSETDSPGSEETPAINTPELRDAVYLCDLEPLDFKPTDDLHYRWLRYHYGSELLAEFSAHTLDQIRLQAEAYCIAHDTVLVEVAPEDAVVQVLFDPAGPSLTAENARRHVYLAAINNADSFYSLRDQATNELIASTVSTDKDIARTEATNMALINRWWLDSSPKLNRAKETR